MYKIVSVIIIHDHIYDHLSPSWVNTKQKTEITESE